MFTVHISIMPYGQFLHLTTHELCNLTFLCMDFVENYTCLYQKEMQSAHWSQEQVTLFSIVAVLNCSHP